MKTTRIFLSIIIAGLTLTACNNNISSNTEELLKDPEKREEIMNAIASDHQMMNSMMEHMMKNDHAMQMMGDNHRMMKHMMGVMKDSSVANMTMENMMGMMRSDSTMQHKMMGMMSQNKGMMRNMMQKMHAKGMMSSECMQSCMQNMNNMHMNEDPMMEGNKEGTDHEGHH